MKERRTKESSEQLRATMRKRIAEAQRLVRQHVSPKTSLVDELIADRREATRREQNRHQ